jgi:hypothetical protein
MSTTSEQKTGRDATLERAVNAPASAPQGVGSTKPELDGARRAYSHVSSSGMSPPLPFRPSRTPKG